MQQKRKDNEHMYCRKCGKEIAEDSFCKYCGEPVNASVRTTENNLFPETLTAIREKIRIFGHEKLVNIVSWLAAIAGVVNRIMHNEIEIVYSALVQDDYFVLAEESRSFAITMIGIQLILGGLLIYDARKRDIWVEKGMYISFVITLLIQAAAMCLRIPAPY